MKKIKVLFSILFFIALFSLSSCYTKKRSVVPCPTWGKTEHRQPVYCKTTVETVKL